MSFRNCINSRFFFSRELFCSSADIQNGPPSLSRTELRIIRVWERPLIFLFLVFIPALQPCLESSKLKNTKHYLVFTEGLNLAFFPSHTFYFENSTGVLSWKQLCRLPRPSVLWLQPHENTSFAEFSVPLWPSLNQAQLFCPLCVPRISKCLEERARLSAPGSSYPLQMESCSRAVLSSSVVHLERGLLEFAKVFLVALNMGKDL